MNIRGVSISRRLLGLALIVLTLSGCAKFTAGWRGNTSEGHYDDAFAQSDMDELLGFGANFASKTSAARAETCKFLLNRQKQAPGAGIQLHLLTARPLSDACGDIPKILADVDAIADKDLPGKEVRQWIAIQTELLRHMHAVSRRLGALERKQKTVQSVLEAKEPKASGSPKGSKESKKDESRLLREKLEAIRAMEKKLDETGDGN